MTCKVEVASVIVFGVPATDWGWDPEHKPVVEIAELLYELVHQMDTHLAGVAASLGLTAPQAEVIIQLADPVPMTEVAHRLRCHASNVTGIIDRLEARDLIERHVDPTDRRVKRLVLTVPGRRLRRELEKKMFGAPQSISALEHDEQTTLRQLLRKALDQPPSLRS